MLTYVHKQTSAAATWTINHNLDLTSSMIEVLDANNVPLLPAKVTKTSTNQIVVIFSSARAGTARIFGSTGVYIDYTGFVKPVDREIDYTHSPAQ